MLRLRNYSALFQFLGLCHLLIAASATSGKCQHCRVSFNRISNNVGQAHEGAYMTWTETLSKITPVKSFFARIFSPTHKRSAAQLARAGPCFSIKPVYLFFSFDATLLPIKAVNRYRKKIFTSKSFLASSVARSAFTPELSGFFCETTTEYKKDEI